MMVFSNRRADAQGQRCAKHCELGYHMMFAVPCASLEALAMVPTVHHAIRHLPGTR
jgi:hypothetical protein